MLVFVIWCRRVEIVESACRLLRPARDWVHTTGRSPGYKARAGIAGVMGGRKGRVASR